MEGAPSAFCEVGVRQDFWHFGQLPLEGAGQFYWTPVYTELNLCLFCFQRLPVQRQIFSLILKISFEWRNQKSTKTFNAGLKLECGWCDKY